MYMGLPGLHKVVLPSPISISSLGPACGICNLLASKLLARPPESECYVSVCYCMCVMEKMPVLLVCKCGEDDDVP